MATYNERLYASRILLIDQDGAETPQSGDVTLSLHATLSEANVRYAYARIFFENSTRKSSKKLKSTSECTLRLKTKTLSGSGNLPSGSSFDAVLVNNASITPVFTSGLNYWDNRFSAMSFPTSFETYLETQNRQIFAEQSIYAVGCSGSKYGNVSYSADATLKIGGISDTNKPYCDIVWEDIVPALGGFAPSGGAFINRAAAQTFTFSVNVANAYDGTVLGRTTTFRWRVAGSSTTHAISVSGQSATVPANTFPAQSEIEWRVECVTSDGISATSEWQRVTTTDAAPLAPSNLVPQNVFLHNDEDNSFTWTHNSPNGTPQARAELQWSADGATWSALASVSGSANYVTVPANTLTAGQKLWRVRTYNADNVAGEWSESVQIVLIGAPVPPAILELATAPRAFVRWSSGDQLGWRVTFTDAEGKIFDSGERYGDAREYRAEGFLADGQAHYSVAVANEYGWSVTEGDFTVENAPSGTISLSAQENEGEALLRWSVSGTFDNLYLLRGDVPIANVTGLTEYRDRSANGTEVYQLLGTVDADYTLSNEAEISVRVETMSIFDVAGGETVELRLKRGSMPVVARSEASDVSYYHFSGQRYPTAYTDGTATGALSITVTLRRGSANDLERFAGKLCCLRDKTGWRGYGMLESIAHSIDRLDDVTLSFTLTDYDEAVAYE